MSKRDFSKDALIYHEQGRAGKIEVISTKPCSTQLDLSLAYSPGVAAPCLEIEKDAQNAYKYTAKGNLVAVLTNGTAVLGLGNIGALAGKPVMEGKGILFKQFADVDVFDIEVNSTDVEEVIKTCQLLEPTFGGINLEDIKAPECFEIEERLKATMNIPVFHDDQHGTAIVGGAGLLNALKIVGKKIDEVKVVFNGAGASAIAIAKLVMHLGVKKENILMCDTKGVITKGRGTGMNKYKEEFAQETDKTTLEEAVNGCDVLFGLSVKGAFSDDMIKSMAENPIIMAMANPDPEITPEEAHAIRSDAIVATGRSDYANQVNNVLCFPFLFRGALDTRSTAINEEMKVAAAYAIAEIALEEVPESVLRAYNLTELTFGKDYIIPKPLDPRVYTRVSIAVAKAAMESGVATEPIADFDQYEAELETRLDPSKRLSYNVINKAKADKKRVGFTFADRANTLYAVCQLARKGIVEPVLIGNKANIEAVAKASNIAIDNIEIIDPSTYEGTQEFVDVYYEQYWRDGINKTLAEKHVAGCGTRFGACLLDNDVIDSLIAFAPNSLEETVASLADVLDLADDYYTVSQAAVMADRNNEFIITDARLYQEQDPDTLADIVFQTLDTAEAFDINPRVALTGYSDFGSPENDDAEDIKIALDTVRMAMPELVIEGDLKFFTAVDKTLGGSFPYAEIKGDANVFVFSHPSAACATIGALRQFGGFKVSARVIQGFERSVQLIDASTNVEDIITITALSAVQA